MAITTARELHTALTVALEGDLPDDAPIVVTTGRKRIQEVIPVLSYSTGKWDAKTRTMDESGITTVVLETS